MERKNSRERLLGNRRGSKSKAACVYLLIIGQYIIDFSIGVKQERFQGLPFFPPNVLNIVDGLEENLAQVHFNLSKKLKSPVTPSLFRKSS
jgi:hypothetical protein